MVNNETIQAYPLCWPDGYPRTKTLQRSKFRSGTFDMARKNVILEIRRLGGTNVIISTNLPLRNDGMPHASARTPNDIGVAVYFSYKNNQVVFACDKWNVMCDNMKAIEKAIEAIRGLDRWGVSDMLNRAFMGFKQLHGAYPINEPTWWEVLEVDPSVSRDTIKMAFREKAKECHPDITGGSSDQFNKLKQAYEKALNLHK